MLNFRSPSAAIFWLWHAGVDDKWKEWECNCPLSTTMPVDLYMKDNPLVVHNVRDRGEEPSFGGAVHPIYLSEDMWVRNSDDNNVPIHEHQNPEYHQNPTNHNYVYVKVRNRGCVASTAGNETLKLSWAKAGASLAYPSAWDGSTLFPFSATALLGDVITTVPIPSIKAGGATIVQIQWDPVNPQDYATINNEPQHFCLLAIVESAADPVDYTHQGDIGTFVAENNNIIWKNISVVDMDPNNIAGGNGEWIDEKLNGATVVVGDSWGAGGKYDFVFDNPATYKGNPVMAEAEVKVTVDEGVWTRWAQGGFKAENLKVSREDRFQVILTGTPAKMKNMAFEPGQLGLLHVSFNFLAKQLSGQKVFDFDMEQHEHATGKLIGGERYHILVPGREGFYADGGGDKVISEGDEVELGAYDIGEAAIYNWYGPDGTLIFTGKDMTVSPEITKKYKLEVIATVDGVKDYDEVSVKVKEFEIISLSPNPSSDQVTVEYKANNATSAYLMVSMPYGAQYNYILDVTQDNTTIDVSGFQPGAYSVILVCNGQGGDTETLIVQ